MATVMKNFEFKNKSGFDLTPFCDGKIYKLTQGIDFGCDVESVRQKVRQWHKDAPNRESHTSVVGCAKGEVIIQLVQLDAPKKKNTRKRKDTDNGTPTAESQGTTENAAA